MPSLIEGSTTVAVDRPEMRVTVSWGNEPSASPWVVSYIDATQKLVQSSVAEFLEAMARRDD